MDYRNEGAPDMRGHNAAAVSMSVEVRLFNSLTGYSENGLAPVRVKMPAGSTLGDVLRMLRIPGEKVYLALRNGRDVTASLRGGINEDAVLDEGDVLALSGPVPYSWGYGSPVV